MSNDKSKVNLVLDFADDGGLRQRLCFTNPVEVIVAKSLSEVRPALRDVEQAAKNSFYSVGYVSYEAAPAFDSALVAQDGAQMPLVWFAIFQEPTDAAMLERSGSTHHPSDDCDQNWEPSVSRDSYRRNISLIRDGIARGDTYQVNYTMRLRGEREGDPFAFYERLRQAQRSRYCAYLDIGSHQILSASPELFFRRIGNRIVMRPMKGTAPRGQWTEEDDCLEAQLTASEKDRAENVMIVDLVRSDLGRIAETGSVRVASLFDIERYPTVFQMTSTIEATLRNETTLDEIFAAVFPSGSVTGAPKASAMKLITELEDSPREIYCGAIGLVKPGGDCLFNVAIRTMIIDTETGTAEYSVGGGITWESTADGEYQETLTKAKVLTHEPAAFQLLETMKLEDGKYFLMERHLDRLANSARFFDVPLKMASVIQALTAHAKEYCCEARRVRLLVSFDGEIEIQSEKYEEVRDGPLHVKLATKPISRRNRMLYHKTTDRNSYEERLVDPIDAFDTLLWNESNELTEFTRGNLVVEMDGKLWTPPVDCGLLPGTLRAALLDSGEISERVIRKDQLAGAIRVWFLNRMRGWVAVDLSE
jgi:para-aminobenzoate synthetase/4-amino-4-deoxychorismate lyase